MSSVIINIDTALTDVPIIEIGKQGENEATQVVFDVSDLIDTFGSGTAYVVVQRRGDAEPYLLDNAQQSSDKVTWTVSNVDTNVYGMGRVQLFWMIGDQVAKSVNYQFYVEEALGNPTDAPVVPGGWISEKIGDLDELSTTAKENLVAAINEVNALAGDNAEDIEGLDTRVEDIEEQLDEKANIDGLYENMTVGNAEQLVSTTFITDQQPYQFRPSGGSLDIGDREYDTLVGGDLVWNQLVLSPLPQSSGNWSVSSSNAVDTSVTNDVMKITVTSNTSGQDVITVKTPAFIKGHKYLVLSRKSANNMYVRFTLLDGWTGCGEADAMFGFRDTVISATESSTGTTTRLGMTVQPWNTNIQPVGTEIYLYSVNLIDLTSFFGSSTIPDYVYTLEQSTAGSGVAWLKQYFPKLFEYHEYDAGTLKSVEGVESHDMVGFNQWDEQWEVGSIDPATGQKTDDSNVIRAKNYIPVLPSTSYYINSPANNTGIYLMFMYTADKEFIGSREYNNISNHILTVPSDCRYLKFRCYAAYGTTYNHDICINIHYDGERDGEYEPYKKWSYPISPAFGGHGIPKLDASGNLYFDGDRRYADGTVETRYGVVVVDGVNVTVQTNGVSEVSSNAFLNSLSDKKHGITNFIASGFVVDSVTAYGAVGRANSVGVEFRLPPTVENTNTALNAWFAEHPTTVIYELATPTTSETSTFQSPQKVDDCGTERYITDGVVPVGHETKYAPNLRAKLEMAPDSPSGDGDYIVRQTSGINAYAPLVKELPTKPSEDGTYTLKCTVSSGTATLSWEVEE